jgi:hypothetical protein
MTQTVPPTTAFPGGVPANLVCGFCGRPMQGQFYRTLDRFACDACIAQVNAVIERNSAPPGAFLAAAGAGIVTALAGGAVWATVVYLTHWNIGILAAFIGVGVGRVVHFVSGKRRSTSLQWLSAILAVIGVAAGKLSLVCAEIARVLRDNATDVTAHNVFTILRENGSVFKDPFDLVWMGIAAYAAWRICKPRYISVAGPYAYQPTGGSLQFDTVEPLHDIPPATPPGQP